MFSTMDCKKIIVGKEVGDEGTRHLQGFISFNMPKGLAGVKKVHAKAHWEIAKGSDQANLTYCSKSEDVLVEKGSFGSGARGGGNAVNLARKVKEMRYKDMTEEEKNASLKFEKFMKREDQRLSHDNMREHLTEEYEGAIFRDWQQKLIEYVEAPPPKRSIRWYVDAKGDEGKTWMSEYLYLKYNAIVFETGKSADLAYMYDDQPIIIFDLSRRQEDYINYNLIESFKNGRVQCPKYESCVKRFKKPHVIVFSNFEPDKTALSDDRWNIIIMRRL